MTHMTPAEARKLIENLESKKPMKEPKLLPPPVPVKKEWWQYPLVWVLIAFILGTITGTDDSTTEVNALRAQIVDLEEQVVALSEDQVVASSALAFVVEFPNEPEDATGKVSEGLRQLGATASCPGECLEWVEVNGATVQFRFNP